MKRQLLGEAGPLLGPPDLAGAAVRNASRQMQPAMPTLGVTHGLAVRVVPAFEVGSLLFVPCCLYPMIKDVPCNIRHGYYQAYKIYSIKDSEAAVQTYITQCILPT